MGQGPGKGSSEGRAGCTTGIGAQPVNSGAPTGSGGQGRRPKALGDTESAGQWRLRVRSTDECSHYNH